MDICTIHACFCSCQGVQLHNCLTCNMVLCCPEECKVPSAGNVELRKSLYEYGSELLVALITGLAGSSGLPRVHKTASILCHLMEAMAPGAQPTQFPALPGLHNCHTARRVTVVLAARLIVQAIQSLGQFLHKSCWACTELFVRCRQLSLQSKQ